MQITRDKAELANSKQLRLRLPQNPFTPYSASRTHVHRSQGHESLVLSFGSSRNYWFLHLFSFFPSYAFMYVQMCMYISAHVHRCLKIISGYFHFFWDKVSRGLGGHQLSWASGHWALGWSCFHTPFQSIWIISIHTPLCLSFLHQFWAQYSSPCTCKAHMCINDRAMAAALFLQFSWRQLGKSEWRDLGCDSTARFNDQ